MMSKLDGFGRVRLMLALSVVGLASIAVTQVISASAGTSPAPSPPVSDPFAAYMPPSGPELPLAQILTTARSDSVRAGVPSPSAVAVAQGSLREVMRTVNPDVTLPSSPGGGQEAWLNSTVDLVSMHGGFTLHDAHVPHGYPAPTGSVLDLVIDTHSGELVGRILGTSTPDLQQLYLVPAESLSAGVATRTGLILGRLYGVGGPARHGRRPAQDFKVVVARAGRGLAGSTVLTSTRTSVNGSFAIRIRPGEYLLAGSLSSGRFCAAQQVLVRAGQSTRTTLTCSIR